MRLRPHPCGLVLGILLLAFRAGLAQPPPSDAPKPTDWPQVQANAAHTGFSPDQPLPPYRLRWVRDLKEPTQSAAQIILVDDRIYVGTGWGNLHALSAGDGKTLWTYRTEAPIFGTPACAEGRVFVTSCDRRVHAVSAADGTALWSHETGEPIWASPVLDGGRVFVAARDGFVYALEAATGRVVWKSPVGGPVLCTPALADGTLYVGAGDMRVYALDARDGRAVWTSERIPGAAFREYWLVASHGTVLATVQHPFSTRHIDRWLIQAVMRPFVEAHRDDRVLVEDEVFPVLVEQYRRHPQRRTHFALDAATGKEKFIPPIVGVEGGGCISMPPAVGPDGWAYTMYGNVTLGASGKAFLGRFRLEDGRMEPLLKNRFAGPAQMPGRPGFVLCDGAARGSGDLYGGFAVMDQSWGVTLGGSIVFPVRDPSHPRDPPSFNWHDLRTGEGGGIGERLRETENLGTFGCGYHSTCSAVAVRGNVLAYKSPQSVLFVFEGRGKDSEP